MSTTEPSKWSTALGASADVNTLPQTTPTGSGLASLSGLFPQITQIPLDSGGIAPERADFNALFKLLGDTAFFLMQGGVFTYSSSYAYRVGDLVMHEGSLYLCIAANGPGSAVKYPTDTAYWRKLALISDMPAVGNGTITVQASGTTIGSFTTNQDNNSIVNIPEATGNAFGVVKADERGLVLPSAWTRLRSGIQIVWGAGNADTPITYLRPFNGNPSVAAMCTDSAGTGAPFGSFSCISDRSNTGMTVRVWDAARHDWLSTGTFLYIAVGFWN